MTVVINGTTGYSGPVGTIGDLTTTGNTTLGDASGDTLTINGSTTTLTQGTANGVAYLNGSKALTTGSSLVFDGTNLGVGTNSPGNKLDVAGTGRFTGQNAAPASGAGVEIYYVSGSNRGDVIVYDRGAAAFKELRLDGSSVGMWTGGTQRTWLDAAGNLGLGVTPSAWGGAASMDFSGNFTVSGYAASIGYNFYYNAGYKYKTNAPASRYEPNNGTHAWYTAASGTAGDPITFTQAMTLDASGRWMLGLTDNQYGIAVIKGDWIGGKSQLGLMAATATATVGTGYFNSSGSRVGYVALDINLASLQMSNDMAGGIITFSTVGSERARIDSSGNLLVGKTSAVAGLSKQIEIEGTGSAGLSISIAGAHRGYWYAYSAAMRCESVSGVNIHMVSGGTGGVVLTNGSTSWGSLSDERKKDIIEPITNAAQKVSTLRAVIGKYKDDEDGKRRSFLIAQDVQSVLPEAVAEEEGNLILQYTDTIPLLVAAIQEQQAIIETLKARLDAANL